MTWTEMNAAVRDAKSTIEMADSFAQQMAGMLSGRLRKVDRYTLARLKAELRSFNSNTGKWNERNS